jgi:Na+/H+ antiporter NhaC
MRRLLFICLLLLGLSALPTITGHALTKESNCVQRPAIMLSGIPFTVSSNCEGITGEEVRFSIHNQSFTAQHKDGGWQATLTLDEADSYIMKIRSGEATVEQVVLPVYSGYWSLLPALLAIIIALISRQVIPSLFLGIWSGAWILRGFSLEGLWHSLLDVVDTYMLQALVPADGDSDHVAIALFTMLTGGMIGIISRNGGMGGIVYRLTRFANTPRRGQASAAFLGIAIFFDDYANTLIVGNTMRPLMDKLRISREKLAYIVDSTAAPIAVIALVTTWVGFQLSLINSTVEKMGNLPIGPYQLMLNAIPYSFYPILALVFIFFVIVTGRDFGPMYQAERMARKKRPEPEQANSGSKSHNVNVRSGHAYLAVVPILVLIISTLVGIFTTGSGSTMREIFGSANPLQAMMWASMLSLLTATILSVTSRQMTMHDTMEAMHKGFHPMLLAVVILTFAWAIADVNTALHTAEFIISMLGDRVDPTMLPLLVFVIAAITAFATGASWGTMGILVPLVIPLAWNVMEYNQIANSTHLYILYSTLASVLAGAVWGDHCSPISDTTILSSISSGCDHIAHVRTQMPYAMVVAAVAMATSVIPTAYGMPWWMGLLIGSGVLLVIIRLFGKTIPDYV